MNILIITFGSRGDVQPYVALGKGLQQAGHAVTVCTAVDFEPFIREHGLAYGYMTGELLRLVDTDRGKAAMEETTGLVGSAKTMFKLLRQTNPLNKQMMRDSWAAAQAAQPDMVIFHPKALAATSIADACDIPAIMAVLQPFYVPTAEFPTLGTPDLPLGDWYTRLTYKAVPLGYRMYSGMINDLRREQMGLGKLDGAGLFRRADGSPVPVMHGFSRHVVPRPSDWPPHASIPGYWFLDDGANWSPPAALQDFLAAGPPPVYAGFGSMAGKDPQRLARIVSGALQKAGVRGIIASGWGGLQASDLPDSILAIDAAPHEWLFPRTAAVIHHGGAGTTAAGLRAGRPTIICPFMGDQPFWGRRVQDLGAGPAPIPQKKLSVDNLAAALERALGEAEMHAAAARLGEQLRAEDGVANAVAIVEAAL